MNTPRPSGDGTDLTRAATELAEALTALRRASGMSLEKFATIVNLSPTRLMLVENGHAVPDRAIFTSYLEVATPTSAERHRLRSLWKDALRLAEMHSSASAWGTLDSIDQVLTQLERRPSRTVPNVGHSSGTRRSSSADSSQDITLSLTKPSWRRSVAKSQADPSLWPDPTTVATVEEFTTALLAIKSSTGLSYEALAAASQRASYPLARSTVHSLCTKRRLPSSPKAVACFIEICGGSREDVLNWSSTWQRLAQLQSTGDNDDGSNPHISAETHLDRSSRTDASKRTDTAERASETPLATSRPVPTDPDETVTKSSTHTVFVSMLLLLALAAGVAVGAILF